VLARVTKFLAAAIEVRRWTGVRQCRFAVHSALSEQTSCL